MKNEPATLANQPSQKSCWKQFSQWMNRPVSAASLALFRIGVGLVMCLEAYSLWHPHHGSISSGKSQLETYFTGADITFNFPFPAFSWLPLLSRGWIYFITWMIALTGLLAALGLFYRIAIVTLFLLWGYLFVVESTRTYWQSYYYLELLVLFFLVWMPAARMFSLDALRERHRGATAPVRVPFWCIFLLRGQLVIAYFYGGVAKVNKDWILDAAPMRWFLRDPGVLGPYERFFSAHQFQQIKAFVESVPFAYFLSYVGVAFDLTAGFLLLFRRTRIFGLILMLIFHATNHFLIFSDIEWFPLVGAWTALIFLDADWPLRFREWVRRPFLKKPELGWFWPGLIFFPIAGAALGWKLRPSPPPASDESRGAGGMIAPALVLLWLGVQALIPLRHFASAADERFTYEGLSFSWRLKSEIRRAYAQEIFIEDDAIQKGKSEEPYGINWEGWHGDRAIYRNIMPGRIDWRQLPEIVVVLEPVMGERIIFNPYPGRIQSSEKARARVDEIWLGLYGHLPESVVPALPFPGVIASLSSFLNASGNTEAAQKASQLAGQTDLLEHGKLPPEDAGTTVREVKTMLSRFPREASSALRQTLPYATEGARYPAVPFLVIEDPRCYEAGSSLRVNRDAWKAGLGTRAAKQPATEPGQIEPLEVYMASMGLDARTMLPLAYFLQGPGGVPRICWNCVRDSDDSKILHTSAQPFYLRRYARRIAELWEKDYGRRPRVHAMTNLSLNGRPFQELVDPNADLASVPVSWFRHNEWVRQLETSRIPTKALSENVLSSGP